MISLLRCLSCSFPLVSRFSNNLSSPLSRSLSVTPTQQQQQKQDSPAVGRKHVTIYLPNIPMYLKEGKRKSNQLTFALPKTANKFEVKQMLTKIYGLDVKKVNTLNVRKSFKLQNRRVKRKAYKKAYVTLESSKTEIVRNSMKKEMV